MNSVHLERLRQAERHVALGKEHLLLQQQIIDQLQREGHDATQAKELLETPEETQSLHVADVNPIRKELGASL